MSEPMQKCETQPKQGKEQACRSLHLWQAEAKETMSMTIVPRTNPPGNYTVDDIINNHCECGADLTVAWVHIDGQEVPCIVCESDMGHLCEPIPTMLAMEWDDLLHWQETAFGLFEEDSFEEARP